MAEAVGAATMITRVLADHDGVTTSITKHRDRTRRNIQRAVNKIFNDRNWAFRFAEGDTTTDADGRFLMPADFVTFGSYGGIYYPAGNRQLVYMPLREYWRSIKTQSATGEPLGYAELQIQGSQQVIGTYRIKEAAALEYAYKRGCPVITDADPGGLEIFPVEWRETTLYEWVIYFQMKDKANAQGVTEQLKLAQDALVTMRRECRLGRPDSTRLVPYGSRRRF